MYTKPALVLAALALLSRVFAAPMLSATYIDVSNLRLQYNPSNDSFLNFDVRDRSPTANDTAHCGVYWSGSSPIGSQFTCQGKTSYSGSVDRWDAYDNFLLHFKHSYHEPTVGVPDYLTVFANTPVNASYIACIPDECASNNATINCAQPSATVIPAPITSMIA